jgi:hypothetical protein
LAIVIPLIEERFAPESRSSMNVHSAAIRLTTSFGVNRRQRHHLTWTLFGVLGLLLTP